MRTILTLAVVLAACGVRGDTSQADAGRSSPTVLRAPVSASPTPVATRRPEQSVRLYGDVLDFRVYYANPNVVIPNDLPPVAGAMIRLPTLGLQTSTDERGEFVLGLGDVATDCATDVVVTAPGFGVWTLRSTPIWTYEHSGGGIRLFVTLETKDQERTYTHKLETPRPGCVRVGSTIRGG